MAVADDLEQSRAALTMINPAPFNAEAPPEALDGDITPTELHYVRSNFAVPTHDGTLEIGGAVDNPITLTLDDLRAMPAVERAVTLECAGNGRLAMRPLPTGEPWGDYAVSTARWTGALLHDVLEQAQPAADGVEVRFEGADHGAVPPQPGARRHRPVRPALRALAAARPRGRSGGRDPDRLRDERRAARSPTTERPFRLIVPHWYAVASVKWLKRIDVLTEPYVGRVPDRPLHLRVARPAARARHPDARPRPHHRPRARRDDRRRARTPCAARPGRAPARSPNVDVSLTGEGDWHPAQARAAEGPVPVAGLVVRLGADRTSAGTPSAPAPPTPPATSSPTSRPGTGSATATTPSRSSTSTCADIPACRSAPRLVNIGTPTSAVIMGGLALSKIGYDRYLEVRPAVPAHRRRCRLRVHRNLSCSELNRERRTSMETATETALGANSEVGTLRTVMVHRPDLAHERLSPTNCHELLFDDVIWVRRARQEFDAFVDLMRERGVEVLLFHELLTETLEDAEARDWLLVAAAAAGGGDGDVRGRR